MPGAWSSARLPAVVANAPCSVQVVRDKQGLERSTRPRRTALGRGPSACSHLDRSCASPPRARSQSRLPFIVKQAITLCNPPPIQTEQSRALDRRLPCSKDGVVQSSASSHSSTLKTPGTRMFQYREPSSRRMPPTGERVRRTREPYAGRPAECRLAGARTRDDGLARAAAARRRRAASRLGSSLTSFEPRDLDANHQSWLK